MLSTVVGPLLPPKTSKHKRALSEHAPNTHPLRSARAAAIAAPLPPRHCGQARRPGRVLGNGHGLPGLAGRGGLLRGPRGCRCAAQHNAACTAHAAWHSVHSVGAALRSHSYEATGAAAGQRCRRLGAVEGRCRRGALGAACVAPVYPPHPPLLTPSPTPPRINSHLLLPPTPHHCPYCRLHLPQAERLEPAVRLGGARRLLQALRLPGAGGARGDQAGSGPPRGLTHVKMPLPHVRRRRRR